MTIPVNKRPTTCSVAKKENTMPPDQGPKPARVFQIVSADDDKLFLDFRVSGEGKILVTNAENKGTPERQQFRVYITGQIQNVAMQDGDGGYLTRVHADGGGIVLHFESFRGDDHNQVWNFKPGPTHFPKGPADAARYTLIVSPAPQQNSILQAMGQGADVQVIGFDPKTDPNAVPLNQSWDGLEI